jgi:hypothetical protein
MFHAYAVVLLFEFQCVCGVGVLLPRGFVALFCEGCLVPKNFYSKTSHQILRHMYEVLNVDETKKTNCTIHHEIARRIF